MLLACRLFGKYLSEKKERPTIYMRKRKQWERHIAELILEGPEAFQKMYSMDTELSGCNKRLCI